MMLKNILKIFDDGIRKTRSTTKRLDKLQATLDGESQWGLEEIHKCVDECITKCHKPNTPKGEPNATVS